MRGLGEGADPVRIVPGGSGRGGRAERELLPGRAGAAGDGVYDGGAAGALQVPDAVRPVVRRAPGPRQAAPGALQPRRRHPRRPRNRLRQVRN